MGALLISSLPLLIVLTIIAMVVINNPIRILILLLVYRLQVVVWVSYTYSSWYGLCVLLVYVGAILVLFMSTCMLSRNYTLGNVRRRVLYVLLVVDGALIFFGNPDTSPLIGGRSAAALEGFGGPSVLALVFYLLLSFLVIVTILFSNPTAIKIENKGI